jgi:HlyD family secretion protein
VQRGPIASGPTFTGDVVALQQVNVVPRSTGVIARVLAEVGSQVEAGQVLVELDHTTQDAAVASAQASVDSAQARLNQLLAGPKSTDVDRAQAAVDQQTANVEAARSRLSALLSGSKPQDIDSARMDLEVAQAKLDALRNGPRPEQRLVLEKAIEVAVNNRTAAQSTANGDCNVGRNFTQYTCDSSRAKVNAAETAVNQAKLAYELAVAPPTATDLHQAEAAVEVARLKLDKALNSFTDEDVTQSQSALAAQEALLRQSQAALEAALNPTTDNDLQIAQAAVRTARAQLETARANLQQTLVTAPFNGVISARLLTEGALATTTSPIMTLVSRNVGIDLAVAQEAIAQLAVGQTAQIRSPGLPGLAIQAEIATISPSADPRTRTFQTRVVPTDQDGSLRPGMSASVSLNTTSEAEAILVPTEAILNPSGSQGQGVFVVEDRDGSSVAAFKTPTFGASDGKMTQILGGLNLGDLVVIQGQAGLANNQGVRLVGGAAPSIPGGSEGGRG